MHGKERELAGVEARQLGSCATISLRFVAMAKAIKYASINVKPK
jgi:hypothetical protein